MKRQISSNNMGAPFLSIHFKKLRDCRVLACTCVLLEDQQSANGGVLTDVCMFVHMLGKKLKFWLPLFCNTCTVFHRPHK